MHNFFNQGQSGRSMIEMLGVLAIIGVLSAGGVWGYNAAMEEYRANKFVDDVVQIGINLQNLFVKGLPSKSWDDGMAARELCNVKVLDDRWCNNRLAKNKDFFV